MKRTSSLSHSDGLCSPLYGARSRHKNEAMYFLLFLHFAVDRPPYVVGFKYCYSRFITCSVCLSSFGAKGQAIAAVIRR